MPSKAEAQKLIQDAVIDLLHINHIDAGDLYYTNGTFDPAVTVDFNSIEYLPRRYRLGRFKVRAAGPLPRPTLSIDNVDRHWWTLIENNDDLLGATVIHREVYRQNLDDGSDPDITQIINNTEYTIRGLKQINQEVVVFQLATPLDVEQSKFGREMLRHVCDRNYRTPTTTPDVFFDINDSSVFVDCPYVATTYFAKDGSTPADWTGDDCGQRLSDCKLRFGADPDLPYQGFPTLGNPNV